ncbi:hypothetical protein KUCAC02_014838 [Chaenocephalus aceratus]|uniref:Uncharacterized protein n=1 Tax=Chaenocephalus aceratus TaxID=36190 RepID=A0ACB9WFW7_CHAAC|nr:hypothetical protein KUCAC02_014838 [Chaenocephalus aceratus]
MHSMPNHYYANVSHEYLDSGLGSYDSQYSDYSHCLSNPNRPRPQQLSALAGPRQAPVHLENNNSSQSCSVPPQNSQQHYGGAAHHQQSYWSDPFQGLPQARTPCSLPSSAHSSHSNSGSYKGQQYHSWGPTHGSLDAFDPQKRMDLRKKLQAIFNPSQVDTVMEMYPHVTNAEKLAAEILKLKAQRGIF